MAGILGGFAIAREGAFFKKEQEADLQRYVEYLKERGIVDGDTGNRSPPRGVSLEDSVRSYEVLGEILQQGARLNVPDAALLQAYEKRVKAKLPPLTEEEWRRWRRQYGFTGALSTAAASNMRLQPNRYASLKKDLSSTFPRSISPEAAEAARRQFMVAMRGLVYGTLLGGCVVASIGSLLCWHYDVTSIQDFRPIIQTWMTPVGTSLQKRLQPMQLWAKEWARQWKVKGDHALEERGETDFSKALKRKLMNGR